MVPELVIGHASASGARLWVHAPAPARWVEVVVGEGAARRVPLEFPARTAVVCTGPLPSGSSHAVQVRAIGLGGAGPAVRGRLRVFPVESDGCRFLLGSCDFPTLTRRAWGRRAHGRLLEMARDREVDFMLHGGDRIYFDLPFPWRRPTAAAYRRRYLRRLRGDPALAELCRTVPQYGTLDDHELVDGFANDRRWTYRFAGARAFRRGGVRAYREMVHPLHPPTFGDAPLYYSFAHGDVQVFVTDTRTERWLGVDGGTRPRIISAAQQLALQRWMLLHRERPKLVLTAVPFVFRVRENADYWSRNDKWGGERFGAQRRALLEFIAAHRVERLCFLTGDMHAGGHAVMRLRVPGRAPLVLHELMASPMRQWEHGRIGQFCSRHSESYGALKVESELDTDAFVPRCDHAMVVEVDAEGVRWQAFATRRRRDLVSGTFPWRDEP